jgi:hypothetical protein
MKIKFNVSGTMDVPDDVIYHFDVAGKLYALEFNDIMYMLQMCLVAEGGAWGNETITEYDVMEIIASKMFAIVMLNLLLS